MESYRSIQHPVAFVGSVELVAGGDPPENSGLMQLVGSLYMLYLAYQVYKMDVSKPTGNQMGTSWSDSSCSSSIQK